MDMVSHTSSNHNEFLHRFLQLETSKKPEETLQIFRETTPQLHPFKFLEHFPHSWIQYYYDPDPQSTYGVSRQSFSLTEAETMQKKHFGVFFSVNPFSQARKKEHCMGPRAFYMDWDAAKMGDGTSPEEIAARKVKMLRRLLLLEGTFLPHVILDTQHGLHAIWMVSGIEQMDPDMYRNHMEEIIAYFGADGNAKDVTRVLRLPGFQQMKDPNNPFLIRLLYIDL